MEGHHVLDVAELLTPGDDGKWGAGELVRAGNVRGPGGKRPSPDAGSYAFPAADAYVLAADDDEVRP
jgi:hypothetical protein